MSQRASPAAVARAGLIALAVAMGIGRFAFTPLLPMMQDDEGLSVAIGGWLASANYLGYLIGALSAMWIRAQAAGAVRAALIVIGAATIAMGLAHTFPLWALLRGIAGVASAWALIHASAWCLERLAAVRRPVLNGMVFGGVGAGIAGVGAICVVLMHAGAGSARSWIVLGALALVLTATVWPTFASDPRGASSGRGSAPGAAPSWDRESLRLVLCYGAFGFGYIIPATFLPVMARQAIHDPLIFGWSWPVFGAAALVSTLGAAMLPPSLGNRRAWIASQLLMALGVALPVFWPGIGGVLFSAVFVGGTFMVTTMVAIREAREVAGPHAIGLIAAMTAAFAVGQIAGPIGASYLVGSSGSFSGALLIASFLLALSAYALGRTPSARR
ncbi:MAG TPA: YbfB/YjiJ family MFS transporter [Burkholderiales bacterium]|nr:YbfB/YjiJ family MFS transporter [Burkholderiales bacterium]